MRVLIKLLRYKWLDHMRIYINTHMKKSNTIEFVNKCKAIHGEEYNYSEVNYIDWKTSVKIICDKHGSFNQTPSHHLRGHKCPKCRGFNKDHYNLAQTGTLITRQNNFISSAKNIHGDRYEYMYVNYTGVNNDVKIVCKNHGLFLQTPHNHLAGRGCKSCSDDYKRKTIEDFISEANDLHKNKYNYSKFVYKNNKHKSIIICDIHGEFTQTPNRHLYYGCKKCNSIGGYCKSWFINDFRKTIPSKIYLLNFSSESEEFIKVGITIRNQRFGKKYRGYAVTKLCEYNMPLYDAFILEQQILAEFGGFAYIPKLFATGNGKTECMKLTEENMKNVIRLIASKQI